MLYMFRPVLVDLQKQLYKLHSADLFGSMYVGSPYVQHGQGISSFLAGLFGALKPLITSVSVP
jgi:hypothetical protein